MEPPSAGPSTYVGPVAPSTVPQSAPAALQRSHAYSKVVGAPTQLPGAAVSVWPPSGVPLSVGSSVLLGVHALASPTMVTVTDERLSVAFTGEERFSLNVTTPAPWGSRGVARGRPSSSRRGRR